MPVHLFANWNDQRDYFHVYVYLNVSFQVCRIFYIDTKPHFLYCFHSLSEFRHINSDPIIGIILRIGLTYYIMYRMHHHIFGTTESLLHDDLKNRNIKIKVLVQIQYHNPQRLTPSIYEVLNDIKGPQKHFQLSIPMQGYELQYLEKLIFRMQSWFWSELKSLGSIEFILYP